MNIKRIIREEMEELQWVKEIPNTIIVGSCIKSSKGVDWTIEDIQRRFNTVIVKSKKGHKQSWDLTALYIQNREGKLKLCTGETVPPNSIPTPNHLQYPKDVNESDDFDWAKEINPIQAKDLRGYYFNYGSDTKKYTIISIELDDYADELIIHYKYPNSSWGQTFRDNPSEYEHNNMKGDTFIYRVKLGDYRLYDKNGNGVDPRNLVYTDNTFDDDEKKEVWEQKTIKESNSLNWIQDTQPQKKDIINFNKERYQTTLDYDDVKIGDKFIPSGSHIVWTIEDIDNWKMVWGTDWETKKPKLIKYFIVWIRNDKGELKRKSYNNKTGPEFPGSYRPWKKIVNTEINESEDEWEWAKTTQPVELQDPKDWVGRQFGYGQEIIDQMNDDEFERGDYEEYFTITGIDKHNNLVLIKHHPVYLDNHDSSTSPRNLRDYISKGKWVWI